MAFVPVARLEELPKGRGLRVTIDGVPVGVWLHDGQVYAMEDTCPHAGLPLTEGSQAGCVVTCEAHGWQFDLRTGFDPHHEDGFPVPCFAVEIADGEVRVDLEARVNPPPRRRNRP